MAALLYLGAGIGIGILSLFPRKDRQTTSKLTKKDLPYVIGMIVLDIAAPILLMYCSLAIWQRFIVCLELQLNGNLF